MGDPYGPSPSELAGDAGARPLPPAGRSGQWESGLVMSCPDRTLVTKSEATRQGTRANLPAGVPEVSTETAECGLAPQTSACHHFGLPSGVSLIDFYPPPPVPFLLRGPLISTRDLVFTSLLPQECPTSPFLHQCYPDL